MHKSDQVSILISTLAEGHTITAACKRAGVSRMFYERHYKTDRKFRKQVDEARRVGRYSNDDLLRTMHLKKVRDGHWPAIRYGIERTDAAEAAQLERDLAQSANLSLRDIESIINALPEPMKGRNFERLRDLLTDATEAERLGLLKAEPGTDL